MSVFRTPSDLRDHFKNHKGDFPGFTEAEYEEAALEFVTKPLTPSLLEFVRPIWKKGDVIRYDQATQEYGTLSADGFVRTYFKAKPDDGTRISGMRPRDMHGFRTNLEYYDWDCRRLK